jgi:hypothetical protein
MLLTKEVVWSPSARGFSEYFGDEYLADDEIVVKLPVAD